MKLLAFKKTLSELDTLKFQLPDGHFVPAHFHITKVCNEKLYRLWWHQTSIKYSVWNKHNRIWLG